MIALNLTACIQRVEEPRVKESPVSKLLKQMVEDDQSLRSRDSVNWQAVRRADLQHREKVFGLLAQGLITDGIDLYRAALILQHADASTCRECYLLAYHLSLQAVEEGHEQARYVAALNLDRYLVFSDMPQRYGTQYNVDSTGRYYLFEYDSTVSDSERAIWQVPPLDSLKARVERLNSGR
jgi:hypothetical protein